MQTTIKTSIATLLLFFISINVMAQDKYDLAIVRNYQKIIEVSYNNAPFESIHIDAKPENTVDNKRPLLEFVSSLTEKGWEIINASSDAVSGATYFLKKKRQN